MNRGYIAVMKITDNGPYITKLILPLGSEVGAEDVDAGTFSVYTEQQDREGNVLMLPDLNWFLENKEKRLKPSAGFLPVKSAYPSDAEGNKTESGRFVTLEMSFGPQYPVSSCMATIDRFNEFIHKEHVITQVKPLQSGEATLTGLVFDRALETRCPELKDWKNSKFTGAEYPITYGYFIPQTEGGKHPLIIWLHGAGEGGTDPTIAYTANKVVNLTSERIQSIFGGAYVLAPQTETYWMDSGNGCIKANGKTLYGPSLMACIRDFVSKNPGIDDTRIYIGGDSNGGFMTVRMVLDYPEYFAAAFPVCEALPDDCMTDDDLMKIVHLPIWFVAAKTDTIVPPERFAVPTVKRLKALGNKDAHMTYWDKVEDIYGEFEPVGGKPFEYMGHFSWVYTYNDDNRVDLDGEPVMVGGKPVTLMQWLAHFNTSEGRKNG